MKKMNHCSRKKVLNFQLENKLADLMGKSMWQTLQQQITLLEAGSRELRELAAKNNKTNSTAEQHRADLRRLSIFYNLLQVICKIFTLTQWMTGVTEILWTKGAKVVGM